MCTHMCAFTYTNTYTVIHIHINIISEYILLRSIDFLDFVLFCEFPLIPYPVASFQLPVSSFQFPASSFQLPVSSFQFPAFSFQLPFSIFRVLVLIYKCHCLHSPSSLHLHSIFDPFFLFCCFCFSVLVRPIVYNSIARCVTLSLPFAGCPTPLGFTPWPRVSWTGPWTDPLRSGR